MKFTLILTFCNASIPKISATSFLCRNTSIPSLLQTHVDWNSFSSEKIIPSITHFTDLFLCLDAYLFVSNNLWELYIFSFYWTMLLSPWILIYLLVFQSIFILSGNKICESSGLYLTTISWNCLPLRIKLGTSLKFILL